MVVSLSGPALRSLVLSSCQFDCEVKLDMCKRGVQLSLVSFTLCTIFCVMALVGIFSEHFYDLKWVSLCTYSNKRHKNGSPPVHSLAFGGRDIYLSRGKRQRIIRRSSAQLFHISCDPDPEEFSPRRLRILKIYLFLEVIAIILLGIFVLIECSKLFDSTLGFPGEGQDNPDIWSKDYRNLTVAGWNTRALTRERLNYCRGLGIDVLAISEL